MLCVGTPVLICLTGISTNSNKPVSKRKPLTLGVNEKIARTDTPVDYMAGIKTTPSAGSAGGRSMRSRKEVGITC